MKTKDLNINKKIKSFTHIYFKNINSEMIYFF